MDTGWAFEHSSRRTTIKMTKPARGYAKDRIGDLHVFAVKNFQKVH